MSLFNLFESKETPQITSTLMHKAAAFDGSAVAMMTVDRDFVVRYVNNSTLKLLSDNAQAFKEQWPDFEPGNIVGTCIDMFHTNPQHQRQLLADPSRLPYRTEIRVGQLSFELSVGGVFGNDGEYLGNVLEWANVTTAKVNNAKLDALDRSQAVIEFDVNGVIQTANENFCATIGYGLDEIQGQHHRLFVEEEYGSSAAYAEFWHKLGRGEFIVDEFKRVGKGGREIWIQASYNPIKNSAGKVFRVVKYATDITAQKQLANTVDQILGEASQVVSALAEGDLSKKVQGTYEGEFDQLKVNLNACVDTMYQMAEQIRGACDGIVRASGEIAEGNNSLSHRTEQQASSLEETAASMEQMTSTIQQNADNAKEANQLSLGALSEAEKGGEVVAAAVEAMDAINDSSKEISDIIGVIEEIAFQTNLLALNAAVEAARAGEQGRGFAVVASEVRNLAQRSSSSAKEITTLIKDSVVKVGEGSKLVNDSGSTLNEIVSAVRKVNDIIGEISAASDEQASGVREISTAVQHMDKMTQQNSAMVEEAAAASTSMKQDAMGMQNLVGFFKVGSSAGSVKASVATHSAVEIIPEETQAAPTVPVQLLSDSGNSGMDDWTEF